MSETFDFTFENSQEAEAVRFWIAFLEQLKPHEEHPWEQVGRCVYCGPCGVRLYQGTISPDHPVAKRKPRKPSEADKMRERWGK